MCSIAFSPLSPLRSPHQCRSLAGACKEASANGQQALIFDVPGEALRLCVPELNSLVCH